jgi:hypothetical protein
MPEQDVAHGDCKIGVDVRIEMRVPRLVRPSRPFYGQRGCHCLVAYYPGKGNSFLLKFKSCNHIILMKCMLSLSCGQFHFVL